MIKIDKSFIERVEKINSEFEEKINRAEGLLCGLVLRKPDVLLDNEINPTLLSENAQFYIGITNRLLKRGIEVVDEVHFSEEVSSIGLSDTYNTLGGWQTVKELSSIASPQNEKSIIDEYTKWNLIREYSNKGIFDIYKHWDKILIMTSSQVEEYLEYQKSDISIKTIDGFEFEKLSYSDKELEDLKNGLEIGIQYGKYSPHLNYLTLGVAKSSMYLFGGYTNSGKSSFIFENMILNMVEDKHKCCVISNEQKSDAFKVLLLEHVLTSKLDYWKIPRKKIKMGQFESETDNKMIQKAREIIKEEYDPYLSFVKIFDYDTGKVNKIVKKMSNVGTEVFFYDTLKVGNSDNKAVWEKLLEDSKSLFQIASKNNIAMILSVQLALGSKNHVRWLDEGVLSNGKQIAEVMETGVYMRDVWIEDEGDGCTYDIKPYKYKRVGGKYTNEKEYFKLDPKKKYKLFFLSKTRADENGQVILMSFNGAFNKWVEEGLCTPHTKNLY